MSAKAGVKKIFGRNLRMNKELKHKKMGWFEGPLNTLNVFGNSLSTLDSMSTLRSKCRKLYGFLYGHKVGGLGERKPALNIK